MDEVEAISIVAFAELPGDDVDCHRLQLVVLDQFRFDEAFLRDR